MSKWQTQNMNAGLLNAKAPSLQYFTAYISQENDFSLSVVSAMC